MRIQDDFDSDLFAAQASNERGRTLRERLQNAPMRVYRSELGAEQGYCGVTCRQFERFLGCLGNPPEQEDDITCEELAAQSGTAGAREGMAMSGIDAGKLSGAANPAAALTPPSWRCPLSGEMCPFAASEQPCQGE